MNGHTFTLKSLSHQTEEHLAAEIAESRCLVRMYGECVRSRRRRNFCTAIAQ